MQSKKSNEEILNEYQVDYFINKFNVIPENQWCVGMLENDNQKCALGHCGLSKNTNKSEESLALILLVNLFSTSLSVHKVNDGCPQYQQKTPKERIISLLNDIKKGQK